MSAIQKIHARRLNQCFLTVAVAVVVAALLFAGGVKNVNAAPDWRVDLDVAYGCTRTDGGTPYNVVESPSDPGYTATWHGDAKSGTLMPGQSKSGWAEFVWPTTERSSANWSASYRVVTEGCTPPASATPTQTPVPPTATSTHTTVPSTATPTKTNTPVPPTNTATPTNTPVPPTATSTDTPTNTPVPPTATATHTPVTTPTLTTVTRVPTSTATLAPSNTPTLTPVPPTATPTNTSTAGPGPTATDTPEPTQTPTTQASNTPTPVATSTQTPEPTLTPGPSATPHKPDPNEPSGDLFCDGKCVNAKKGDIVTIDLDFWYVHQPGYSQDRTHAEKFIPAAPNVEAVLMNIHGVKILSDHRPETPNEVIQVGTIISGQHVIKQLQFEVTDDNWSFEVHPREWEPIGPDGKPHKTVGDNIHTGWVIIGPCPTPAPGPSAVPPTRVPAAVAALSDPVPPVEAKSRGGAEPESQNFDPVTWSVVFLVIGSLLLANTKIRVLLARIRR